MPVKSPAATPTKTRKTRTRKTSPTATRKVATTAKKPAVKEEISDEQPATPSEVVSESMTSYVQQLAKRL